MRNPEGGFSIAEVVAALGLLAGVLISMAGLFVLSSRQLNSGRNSSEALAVARDVQEEMNGWAFHRLYSNLPGCSASASSCQLDSRDGGPALAWQQRLDETVGDGSALIRVESLDGGPMSSAGAVRVSVTVSWREGPRWRTVALVTVRV